MSFAAPTNKFNEKTADLPREAGSAWPTTETLMPHYQSAGEESTPDPVAVPTPPPETPFPTSGSVLRKRYVLGEILGRGGAAIVYRAQDLATLDAADKPREVALKLLRPDCYQRAVVIERLKREFQLAHTLSHPNSVRIYDLDRHDSDGREIWFMTMELLIGQNLATLMASSPTAFASPRIRKILIACGNILTYAHERGVIHGDFKPGNVFVTRKDEVRVLDFGNAHQTFAGTPDVQRAATFCYASPEVLMGMQPTPSDDVFSLACVAYELFNGRHPYDRRSTLEALTAKLRPARPEMLGERQWAALQAGLSFVRDRRPPIRTLLAELFMEEPPVVPIVEQVAPMSPLEAFMTGTHVADVIKPDAESIQRKTRDRDRSSRSLAAKLLLGLLGLALIVAAWQSFGPARFPTEPEIRSSVNSLLLSMREALERTRQGTGQIPVRESTPNPPEQIPTVDTPPAEAVDSTPAIDTPNDIPKPLVTADKPATPAVARQPVSASTRIESATSSYIAFTDLAIQVGEQTSAAAIGIRRTNRLTGSASVRWRTVSGTARANEDFVPAEGRVDFPEGLEFRILYIPLINDGQHEEDEQFKVELYEPANRTLIGPLSETTVTIKDDD